MLRKVDELLNSITMYRLILYYLIFLWIVSFLFSFFNTFPFKPAELIVSTVVILIVSYLTNHFFAKLLKVQTNVESLYITALILTFLITPSFNITEILFTILASFLAMASKYIFAIRRKHVFNPAAISMVILALFFNRYASWWIGSNSMLPFLLVGFLVIRKIRRFSMVFAYLAITLFIFLFKFDTFLVIIPTVLFFVVVMLPEPLTTPPTRRMQIIYGIIVGFLFSLQLNLGIIYLTLEVALCIGNVFSYIVSSKQRLKLYFDKKVKLTESSYDFIFKSKEKLNFKPGQYLEWTLGSKKPDIRGTRRYFTISSSPTEQGVKIAIKLPEGKTSTFKQELMELKKGDKIIGSQLAGDFILPENEKEKLVFITGGIGITPFRSMIKYLIDTNQKRDIFLMYAEKNVNEFVYKDIFSKAIDKGILKVVYYESDKKGHMTADVIKEKIIDYKERTFYLSGPHAMVTSFEDGLAKIGIERKRIKVDYFPGY